PGRVRACHEVFFTGGNHEASLAVQRRVRGAVGIVLKLLVAPAVAADLVRPMRSVRRLSRGPIELVLPHGGPAPWLPNDGWLRRWPRPLGTRRRAGTRERERHRGAGKNGLMHHRQTGSNPSSTKRLEKPFVGSRKKKAILDGSMIRRSPRRHAALGGFF